MALFPPDCDRLAASPARSLRPAGYPPRHRRVLHRRPDRRLPDRDSPAPRPWSTGAMSSTTTGPRSRCSACREATLAEHGAVSEATAREMVRGALGQLRLRSRGGGDRHRRARAAAVRTSRWVWSTSPLAGRADRSATSAGCSRATGRQSVWPPSRRRCNSPWRWSDEQRQPAGPADRRSGARLDAARPRPGRTPIDGRFCRIEPLDPARHAAPLFEANAADAEGGMWTYMAYGPFASAGRLRRLGRGRRRAEDPLFHAIVDRAPGQAVGVAAYLRIEPAVGVIEVGHIAYSPLLQRTAAATEAMYLLMRRAFDELGYRRYEWKCDALNAPSRAAADAAGLPLRGHLPAGHGLQGPQPRHRLVLDHRHGMAGAEGGVRGLARPGQLHRRRAVKSARWRACAARASMKQVDVHRDRHGRRPAGTGHDQGRERAPYATRSAATTCRASGACWRTRGGRMLVHVRLGAPADAGRLDLEAVRASLPHGEVTRRGGARAACWCPTDSTTAAGSASSTPPSRSRSRR